MGVIDSRHATPNQVRRRRKCVSCDYRETTLEITASELDRMMSVAEKASRLVRAIQAVSDTP